MNNVIAAKSDERGLHSFFTPKFIQNKNCLHECTQLHWKKDVCLCLTSLFLTSFHTKQALHSAHFERGITGMNDPIDWIS